MPRQGPEYGGEQAPSRDAWPLRRRALSLSTQTADDIRGGGGGCRGRCRGADRSKGWGDRKSTRLNSSHVSISYAVFCLKKKFWQASAAAARRARPVAVFTSYLSRRPPPSCCAPLTTP